MSRRKDAEIREGREDLPIFIHSALDDYGLWTVEFRVYARLARRCGHHAAFESVPSMAVDFEVSERTIQRALRVLVMCRLVDEQRRPGQTTLYTLNPQSAWLPRTGLKAVRERVYGQIRRSRDTGDTAAGGDTRAPGSGDTREGGGVTPETDEGSPPEGSPSKVLPHTPPAPSRADEPEACVCVCGFRYSLEDLRKYARNQSPPLGEAWVGKAYDECYRHAQVADWLKREGAGRAPNASASTLDASACPDCRGTGFYYPHGVEQGVARCRHERMERPPPQPAREARAGAPP